MKKMCDSLEYLASEYYLFYYAKKITEDKAFSDANLKYNQKFNVTFSGNMSIKVLPNDYKIRFDKHSIVQTENKVLGILLNGRPHNIDREDR